MSSLMFVSLCGPPLAIGKPVVYVKSWLVKGRREANSTQGPARPETVLNFVVVVVVISKLTGQSRFSAFEIF
jgi:hypothetical protein